MDTRPRDRNLRFGILALTALLALAALVAPLPVAVPSLSPQARTIDVNARQFAYEPGTLTVQRGDTITVHLESLDAAHGLSIDGYNVNLQAEPGKSADITFTADKEGTFKFRCSISCGALHPFMIGELNVEPDSPLARALLVTLVVAVGAVLYFWK